MEVVILKSELEKHHACDAYLTSPEWDAERGALVYVDWDATATRLLADRDSAVLLDWLVEHRLVPMTKPEFLAARKAAHGV